MRSPIRKYGPYLLIPYTPLALGPVLETRVELPSHRREVDCLHDATRDVEGETEGTLVTLLLARQETAASAIGGTVLAPFIENSDLPPRAMPRSRALYDQDAVLPPLLRES
jgi:hypothetical protein